MCAQGYIKHLEWFLVFNGCKYLHRCIHVNNQEKIFCFFCSTGGLSPCALLLVLGVHVPSYARQGGRHALAPPCNALLVTTHSRYRSDRLVRARPSPRLVLISRTLRAPYQSTRTLRSSHTHEHTPTRTREGIPLSLLYLSHSTRVIRLQVSGVC